MVEVHFLFGEVGSNLFCLLFACLSKLTGLLSANNAFLIFLGLAVSCEEESECSKVPFHMTIKTELTNIYDLYQI